MMNNIETMKLALKALEEQVQMANGWQSPAEAKAITALRQAIEQAQQAEPVAWCVYCDGQFNLNIFQVKDVADVEKVRLDLEYPNHKRKVVPLYTSPPPRQPLTDEEIRDALEAEFLHSDGKRSLQDDLRVARAIEAAHGIGEKA